MFEDINSLKYIDVLEIGEDDEWNFRILIAEAGTIEDAPALTILDEKDENIRALLNKATPIGVKKESRMYEILFKDYITYSVLNESFVSADPDEEFEGRLVRVYSKSTFLDYVASTTFATAEYPGPYKHYCFCCLNHVVEVAAQEPPTMRLVNA